MPGIIASICTPQMSWIAERSISISPKDAITRMTVSLARRGLKKARSMPMAMNPVAAIASGSTMSG